MDELQRNSRNLVVAFVSMLVVTGAVITFGMLLFPLSAYQNPRAGLIPGLINTPPGNIIVIALLGVIAVNIGAFLTAVTRLERERSAILARNVETHQQKTTVVGEKKAQRTIDAPQTDSVYKPKK